MFKVTGKLPLVLALAILGGCSGLNSTGNLPRTGYLVPDKTLQISPSISIPLENLVIWGAYAGAAYLILDPLAPNWEIEEAPLPDNYIHFSLKMKRFYAGGAGEARVVFNRRAKELMQYGGFDAYQVMEYSEGLESSVLGSRRVSEGVVRLTRKTPPDQGRPAPSTPDKAEKPLS